MKKQLNARAIMSELRGESAFFKDAVPQARNEEQMTSKTVRSDARTHVRTDGQDGVDPTQRRAKRHPFEIYADQLKRLQTLKAEALMKGESLSMSQMVRDAIDRYLADRD